MRAMEKMLTRGQRSFVACLACTLAGLGPALGGVARPDHVVIAIEENKSFSQIIGSSSAPYINALAQKGALFTSSSAIGHPSQPNYLALFSGSTQGIGDDSCPHTFASANLASQLFQAGRTFAGYAESMPNAGSQECKTSDGYARKHNPWVNFSNVPASANLPFSSFPGDFKALPTVAIVVPNLDNDMHDGSIREGDAWLRDHLDPYVQWAMANNSLFILTWDEDERDIDKDHRIVTIFVGPMVRPGEYGQHIDHYNVLRTLLEMYGLSAIGKAANATPIANVWTTTVESDKIPPAVSITTPSPNGRVTNSPLTVQGIASDNVAVSRVELQVGDGPFQTAAGTTDWSAQVNLAPGPSTLRVRSVDAAGNISSVKTLALTYVVLRPLTVHITGQGRMIPDLSGQNLEVGRSYSYKAVPDPGFLAATPGGGGSTAASLRFTMQDNLVLEIHFIPNPFPSAKGTYQGLIYDTNGVTQDRCGFFSLALNANGRFSGSLRLGRKSFRLSDSFDGSGHALASIGLSPSELPAGEVAREFLEVDLQLDWSHGTDRIGGVLNRLGVDRMGNVVREELVAELFGDRPVFNTRTNPAPSAGRYTVTFPGNADGAYAPAGDGFGAVTVDGDGRVRLAGMLADGTKVTQSAMLSKDGQWPLYLSLYGGAGTFLGRIHFAPEATSDLQGPFDWIKLSRPTTKYYPGGFTNASWAAGLIYQPPTSPAGRVLPGTSATLAFQGGNLVEPFQDTIRLDAPGSMPNQDSHRLTLRFTPGMGLWKGTVADPSSGRSIVFQGAVLQAQNSGSGFFLGTNQSGRVRLQAQ